MSRNSHSGGKPGHENEGLDALGRQIDQARNRAGTEKANASVGSSSAEDNDPERGGYYHADTEMKTDHSEAIADLEQAITGSLSPEERADSTADPAAQRKK